MKVLHQKLGEKFYRKKGVIEEVREQYTAVIKMIETGDIIKIDQTYLETVIPALGKDHSVKDSLGSCLFRCNAVNLKGHTVLGT